MATPSDSNQPKHCPDCGIAPGMPHVRGCDIERCSVCGGQWIACGHEASDPAFSRWTGFYPGSLEADALGIDLNEFHGRRLNELFFVKPSLPPVDNGSFSTPAGKKSHRRISN